MPEQSAANQPATQSYTDKTGRKVTDLSHEQPFADDDIGIIRTVIPSRNIGHAVVFVGEAQAFADTIHINPDPIVADLEGSGVPAGEITSLVAVVHHPKEVEHLAGLVTRITGWHADNEELRVLDPDETGLTSFSHTLHLVPHPAIKNSTVWHEAGHLHAHLTGIQGSLLYQDRRNTAAMQAAGWASTGVSGLSALHKVWEQFPSGVNTAVGLGILAVGLGGIAAVAEPRFLLWHLSPEERQANRFARQRSHINVVGDTAFEGVPHILAQKGQLLWESNSREV